MPDVLELIAKGIHKADEAKGAPPWEQQSFFVREAQMDRARAAYRALEQAGFFVGSVTFLSGIGIVVQEEADR